ncbi:MspA family porin [Nocardia sp. CA-290969]|uniref:MspA family porin n=1 Tax=Nocardia sp. CA-290969 TaxID=3239986 RepID=UPI003D8C28D6
MTMIRHRTRIAVLVFAAAAVALSPLGHPSAAAEVALLGAHERSVTSVDGRALRVGHRAEEVDRVTGGLLFPRAALVSNEAYAAVSSRGKTPLTDAELTIGYHVGCAIALAKISTEVKTLLSAIGVNMEQGVFAGRSTIVVKPDETLPRSRNASTVYPGMKVEPEVTVTLESGSIADIRMAVAPVRNGRAHAGIRRTSISVDGCIGPVAIRSYAALTTKSALADETVVVYGDPALL